ncbi:EF-P beta-lysylation protein EpmB [Frateuria aurantia]
MITASLEARTPADAIPAKPDWRELWRQSVTDPRELLRRLDLQHLAEQLPAGDAGFPVRVPPGYLARIQPGHPRDPLLLQVMPQLAELEDAEGFRLDPVGDMPALASHGVLHKYQGRALLIASGSCAIHCRYCFRRHFPYAEETAAAGQWQEAVAYLRGDSSIHELLLSGGDPLSLSNAKLAQLSPQLAELPHLKRLRIHTRLPAVLPERVDAGLLEWLHALPLQKVMVLHINHPQEIGPELAAACERLRQAGVTLLNQAVLLRAVNDQAETLAELSEQLFACGVLPYYLHQLDRVQGASHFEVADTVALQLIDDLRGRLPGYLVPRLVREVAGDPAKRPIY